MPKKLSTAELKFYEDNGYLCPIVGLSEEKAKEYRRRLEESEAKYKDVARDGLYNKSHLLFKWADELVHEPGILDAIEDLIGPNILIYTLRVWVKEPNSASFVSWHQDATYHMKDTDSVSAWVSLTDTTVQAGCMEVVPGTHKLGQLEFEEDQNENNLLSMGQTTKMAKELTDTAFMAVRPGQFSMHHSYVLHRSGPNRSDDRRIGVAINCIPTSCRSTSDSGVKLTAALVRGVDRYHHFDLEPRPVGDFDQGARAAHAMALGRYAEMKKAHRAQQEAVA
jgi:chlorinating enzyme